MKLFATVLAVHCATCLLWASGDLCAAVLVTEDFEYADGELQSASKLNWLKHSGSGGQYVVNAQLFIDDDGTGDYSRALGDFPPIRSGAVYAAFDLNVSTVEPPENTSTTAPYFMHFSEEFGGTSPQVVSRLVMNPGSAADTFRLGIVRGGGSLATTSYWGANLTNGETHRVVVGYDLDAAVSMLWVNPTSTASAAVTNATGTGLPIFGLNWLAFRIDGTNGRSGDKTIDNLVVATLLSDVLSPASSPENQPADFNGDGMVDGADFVVWQSSFPTASGANLAMGDADGDGDVDGADFVVWQTGFAQLPSAASVPVPEPAGILSAIFMVTLALLMRRL